MLYAATRMTFLKLPPNAKSSPSPSWYSGLHAHYTTFFSSLTSHFSLLDELI